MTSRSLDRRTLWLEAVLVAVLAVLLAWTASISTVSSAAFSAATGNSPNRLATAMLAPPTSFTASESCGASAAIAFRGATTGTLSGRDVTLPRPAGVQAGDALLAMITRDQAQNEIPAPSGWRLFQSDFYQGHLRTSIFVRIATGSEPGSYTFTASGGGKGNGLLLAYSGVDTSSPIEDSAGTGGSSSTATSPGVTTTVDGARLVGFSTIKQTNVGVLGPPSMTERVDDLDPDFTINAADEPRPAAGPTGTRSTSFDTSDHWTGQLVALRPAGGPPDASLSWNASTSTSAEGYRLRRFRGSTLEREWYVTPAGAQSAADGPLVNGASYQYRIATYDGSWVSAEASTSLTPSC